MRPQLLSLAIFLTLAACGASPAKPATTPPTPASLDDSACPVAVPGTSVAVEDTEAGAAFAFVTTGDGAEVRRRVAAMAKQHNEHHAAMGESPGASAPADGSNDHGAHGGHDMAGKPRMSAQEHAAMGSRAGLISTHSRATVEDIEGGARLVFATGADQLGSLRAELRAHAEHLSAGTCAMSEP